MGGSFSKERPRKRVYLFPPQRSLRICLISRHLINSPTERALENVHIIYQCGGGNSKQKIGWFSLTLLLSLLHPSSGPPHGRRGRERQGRAALGALPSQTQLQNSLLVFSRKLEHFSKWKIFCRDVLFYPKYSFPENYFNE